MMREEVGGLELRNIVKRFGGETVLKGLSLSIRRGEFFSLLGPSGCGKTTLLRIIAGFERPDAGSVLLDGTSIDHEPPHRRPVNTVFQNYALFPHMDVFDNVAFGLRIRGVSRSEIAQRVEEMLMLVNLPEISKRAVHSLSGGEKQRIALARALVNRPAILLLDEPLGALDLQLRRKMQFEIKEIHRKIGTTFVYVTHDQEEALAMSDRIAVMIDGQVEQVGAPQEIYDQPESRFVARFIGASNLLEGKVTERIEEQSSVRVDVAGLGLFQTMVRNGTQPGAQVGLIIRPEKIQIVHDSTRSLGFPATIEETLYLGALIQYRLRVGGEHELFAVQQATAQRAPIRPGQRVRIRWAPEDMVLVEK